MPEGVVAHICIGPERGQPTVSVAEVLAVPGKGLEGDRFFKQAGDYSYTPASGRDLTLIEIEAIEALERDYGLKIAPIEARRNIVTRGIALNHLVGREFRVGEVTLRGVRLCEPCAHLASLTDERVLPGLVHRGGLRAQILTGGTIRVADPVTPLSVAAPAG